MRQRVKIIDVQDRYLKTHNRRFELVLDLIEKYTSDINKARILDIGPSFLTQLMKNRFSDCEIECLGITGENRNGGHLPSEDILDGVRKTEFNLNNAISKDLWPRLNQFDLIVIAEVIEHLYIAPEYIFQFLRSLLKSNGIVILQTPNAVSLVKRIRMIKGRNPFNMIRMNYENPGHFREYTMNELKDLSVKNNFEVLEAMCDNYFNVLKESWRTPVFRQIQNILGDSFKDGITLVLKKSV